MKGRLFLPILLIDIAVLYGILWLSFTDFLELNVIDSYTGKTDWFAISLLLVVLYSFYIICNCILINSLKLDKKLKEWYLNNNLRFFKLLDKYFTI